MALTQTDGTPAPAAQAPWFGLGLVVLTLLGMAARIAFAVVWTVGKPLLGDPLFYQQTGANLAHGRGYVIAFLGRGTPVPTALHPPVFSTVLAGLDLVGLTSVDSHRIALAVIASGAVVAMGLLGRRIKGPVVGLVAAGIAALGPLWIQPAGKMLSESIYLIIVPVLLIAALGCLDHPTLPRFFVVGLMLGVAGLTRGEGNLLLLLLGVPLVLLAVRPWKRRGRLGILLLAGFALVVVPWVVRNDVQLGGLTLSTDSGTTLVGAYADSTFSPNSSLYGSFDQNTQFGDAAVLYKYSSPPDHARRWTELTLNGALGHIGKRYALGHLSDLPGVVLARQGRLWGVYDTGPQLTFDLASDGIGVRPVQVAGEYVNWVLLPLAVLGGIVLSRVSRRELIVVLGPVATAALSGAITFGSTRYRAVAEPSIAVLAAVAAVWLVERLRRRRRGGPAGGTPDGAGTGRSAAGVGAG